MDPLDYLRILRRRWWVWGSVLGLALIAAVFTLSTGGDAVSRGPLDTTYTATHTLLQAPDEQNPVNLPLTRLFATTGEIPRLAATALGRPADEGPQLAARVTVTVDPDVAALRITSSSTDGEEAARTANAFGEAVKRFLRERAEADRAAEVADLQARLGDLEERILALQRRLVPDAVEAPVLQAQQDALANQYRVEFERLQLLQGQAAVSSSLDTLEEAVALPANATGSPVPTSPVGRLGLATIIGLVLGVGLALAVDRLDNRVRSRDDVEQATGLAVIAEVPRLPKRQRGAAKVVTTASPGSSAAEAYRGLRAAVLLVPSRPIAPAGTEALSFDPSTWSPPQVLLVTSPVASDGKTSTVVNLAAAMAESGRSVIVIDADFRNPNANRYLGVARAPGLSDLLEGSISGGVAAVLRPTSIEGVSLITSGTISRTPASMLSRLGDVLSQARTLASTVIIDVAPMLSANDATDIVPHVDSVIVVTHAGRTPAPQAERTVDLLARLAVPVLGVVVQAAPEADGAAPYTAYADRMLESIAPQASASSLHGTARPRAGGLGSLLTRGSTSTGAKAPTDKPKTTRTSHAKRP